MKDNIKYWTGGKVILDAIKKNKKEQAGKLEIWRPETFEIIEISQNKI